MTPWWVLCGWSTGFPTSYDSFTTKNHSRWISFNFVCDTFTTDFYSRLANESWSRFCCRRFGQSTSRMPSCDFYAITWFYKPKPSHDVETKQTLLEMYFLDHLQRHVITSRLVRSERVVNLSGTRWITRKKQLRMLSASKCLKITLLTSSY
jgi:hypothetical protein